MTWELPTNILSCGAGVERAADRGEALLEALARLGAPCNAESRTVAPQAVRYELEPCDGVRMKSFRAVEPDLMQMLGIDSVRIQAPTPGRHTVGIELPRDDRQMVYLGDLAQPHNSQLAATVGVDITGKPLTIDIAELPHLLIGGQSGGGKSVMLHALICSLLTQKTPDELELILIDPKMVEAAAYEGLPHVTNLVYNPMRAVEVLLGAAAQMDAVYDCIRAEGFRNLEEWNAKLRATGQRPIPRRLIVVDEVADLVMQAKGNVESAMIRLGQKGRAAGFHVVLATQSPRVQVVTGLLKANMTGRLALSTASALDSRIILDTNGAEGLLGRGDLLYNDGASIGLKRAQAAFVSREEVSALVEHWACQTNAVAA
jgi:DNA segregation ATPase FtsK/SpoIIIE, S-DNA-T family